jgi:XTP/dITP diphosphohydrolase
MVKIPNGSGLQQLLTVMNTLRSPGGCPWDAQQDHKSLLEYLLEESHEFVEAVQTGDRDDLREELGDVLLQVVFHSRIAQEHKTDPFDIDEVASRTAAKLIQRHPHVFSDAQADTASDVEAIWHEQKKVEKERESLLDGIPRTLPALMLGTKVLKRTKQLQVPMPGKEFRDKIANLAVSEETVGDLLFAITALSRELKIDPEQALRTSISKYEEDVRRAETTN